MINVGDSVKVNYNGSECSGIVVDVLEQQVLVQFVYFDEYGGGCTVTKTFKKDEITLI